jgi:hypothetical protein
MIFDVVIGVLIACAIPALRTLITMGVAALLVIAGPVLLFVGTPEWDAMPSAQYAGPRIPSDRTISG